MAEIYLAVLEGSEPPHQLAIKVIHQQNADDPDFVRMLVDEARLAVQLKHPNIVTTYDLGLANDQYYIVMELVEGADLFRLQQRAADQRLSFPIALAAYIAREVARGLDYAHRLRDADDQPLQVVHRDISPQNVLLAYDGAVKITDFGIAKAERRAAQTQAGIIKGKYYYMSPEQASGQFIDARTDIFAAGILLYEMLIGEMLYYDENVERLMQAVRKADIPPVSQRRPDTPPALERILMKALSKSPSDRYQTAAEYGQALDTYLRRYAPRTGAADVGAFLEKLIGQKARPRSLNESTAALSVSAATGFEDDDRGDETVGLSSGQIRQLAIADDNSLIFQSKVHPPARRSSSSVQGAATASARSAGPVAAASPASSASDDEGLIKTTHKSQKSLGPQLAQAVQKQTARPNPPDRPSRPAAPRPLGPAQPQAQPQAQPGAEPKLVRRGSSSGTIELVVPSLGPGGSPASGTSPAAPSSEASADSAPETGGAARPPGSRVPFSLTSKPAEVFRAIEPESEEELLAAAADVAPQPYTLTGPRRVVGAPPRHEPLAAQLASSEVTVPRAEVPPELLAALIPQPEDRRSPRPPPPPAAPPREPLSGEQSAKVELLQSDLAFSDPAHLPVGPGVEMAQDANFSDPQLGILAGAHPPHGMAGGAGELMPSAVSDPSLDAISAESTHSNLKPTPHRSDEAVEPLASHPAGPPSYTDAVSPPGAAPSRLWPYWLSGISAALLSAGLTWYLTGPGAHHDGPAAASTDLLTPGPAPPVLALPETPVPETEPPPAGETESPPPSPPGPSTPAADGELVVDSKPSGAEVLIDKKSVGQTPLTLHDLATDKTLKLELRLSGFKSVHKRLKWRGKTHLAITASLHREGEGDGPDDGDKPEPEAAGDKSDSGSAPKPGT